MLNTRLPQEVLITFIIFSLIRSLQTNRADMDKVLVRMRQFRLHGNCGLGFHWPFVLVDQFGCFDYVAVFLRLQMKTTECSRLPYSKFGDSSTTPPLGCRTVRPRQPHIVVFRIANADILARVTKKVWNPV